MSVCVPHPQGGQKGGEVAMYGKGVQHVPKVGVMKKRT